MDIKEFILNNWDLNKIIDPNVLEAFVKVLQTNLNIKDYLTDIEIRDMSSMPYPAAYNIKNKKIVIDLNALIFKAENYVTTASDLGQNPDDIVLFSFYKAILHEAIHASEQKQIFEENLKTSLSRLLTFSYNITEGYFDFNDLHEPTYEEKLKGKELYRNYHNYFLHERHADVGACLLMVDILSELNIKDIGYYNFFVRVLFDGYKDDPKKDNPLNDFLKIVNVSPFEDYQNLSLMDRFAFGLPLTKEELASLKDQIAAKMTLTSLKRE